MRLYQPRDRFANYTRRGRDARFWEGLEERGFRHLLINEVERARVLMSPDPVTQHYATAAQRSDALILARSVPVWRSGACALYRIER